MSRHESTISNISTLNKEDIYTKLVVLGKSLVGKSALTFRFINDQFPKEHDTTIEDQYKTTINIDGYQVKLEILDTAGQDDYQSMLETWISYGSGFLLVYSIDDMESFEEVKKKYDKLVLLKGKEIFSCIVVGNKCDLNDELRKVPKNMGEEFAASKGIPFLESSALTTINVKEAFIRVVHDLMEKTSVKKSTGIFGKLCGCNLI